VVDNATMGWNLIDTAPFDRDLELAVIDSEGAHSLSFPCRRIEGPIPNTTAKAMSSSILDNASGPPTVSLEHNRAEHHGAEQHGPE
jgi:hypothetical protein